MMIIVPVRSPEQFAYFKSLCKKFWFAVAVIALTAFTVYQYGSLLFIVIPAAMIFGGWFLVARVLWRLGSK